MSESSQQILIERFANGWQVSAGSLVGRELSWSDMIGAVSQLTSDPTLPALENLKVENFEERLQDIFDTHRIEGSKEDRTETNQGEGSPPRTASPRRSSGNYVPPCDSSDRRKSKPGSP